TPHVRLPRVGARLAAASGLLLSSKSAADLGSAGPGVHVGDAAIRSGRREKLLGRSQAVGEDGAGEALGNGIVRAKRLVQVLDLEDVEDGSECLLPGDREGLVARREDQHRLHEVPRPLEQDRKSTRLNSSHRTISYAVF